MSEDDTRTDSLKNNDLTWNNFKQFQHRYLVNVPTCSEDVRPYNDTVKYFHLPYPILNPVFVRDFDLYTNLFKCESKLASRMEYCRKLFRKDKILKQHIKKKKIIELPQYIIDLVQNSEENSNCNIVNYTGGVLDTFYLDGKDYIVHTGLRQATQVTEINDCRISFDANIEDTFPIYCIKTSTEQDYALVSFRHESKTSVIQMSRNNDTLQQDLLCRTTSKDLYTDMSFNPTQNKEYATLTNTYKLRILDLENCKVREKYTFQVEDDTLSDRLGQIEFIDNNTVCFMNRCSVYLLDLRSLQTQKFCLKSDWLECDDLCCISKNIKYTNCLYVASKHKLMHLDIRLLKQDNHVMHMLSSAPFIASVQQKGFEENICLYGQHLNDQVLIHDNGTLSTPLYVSNTMDTLTKVSLTNKFNFFEDLEQRLSLPVLGMKLHKDSKTDDIVLYTSTTAGDVFKQKCVDKASDDIDAAEKLFEWIKMIPRRNPKILEVTSIRNLSKMVYNITNNFPMERNLKRLVGTDVSQKFKKRFGDTSRYAQNNVGEAINAIWDDTIADATEVEPTSAQNKVSDWLSSVP